jgi:hypothetical protein
VPAYELRPDPAGVLDRTGLIHLTGPATATADRSRRLTCTTHICRAGRRNIRFSRRPVQDRLQRISGLLSCAPPLRTV